jgi:RHS repeat-associated protein
MNARYQNPNTGRFISEDPVFLTFGDNNLMKQLNQEKLEQILVDPQQLNSYSYAKDNPIINTDPTGQASLLGLFNPLGLIGQLGVAVLYIAGRPASAELLEHSLSLNPQNIQVSNGSDVVNTIQNAPEYKTAISNLINNQSTAGATSFSNVEEPLNFKSGDAHTAIGKVDLYVSGTLQSDNTWSINVSGTDRYDFDPGYSGTGITAPAGAYGYSAQQTQAVSNYTTSITFQQIVAAQTKNKK